MNAPKIRKINPTRSSFTPLGLFLVKYGTYFAILIDGATDKHVTECEIIYCRFNNPDTAEVEFKFLFLYSVESAKGYGMKKLISQDLGLLGKCELHSLLINLDYFFVVE